MGSRNAFVDVEKGNFSFVEGGQKYETIGFLDDVEIIVLMNKDSVKAPEFSHANQMYAVIQDNKLKHLATYDINHKQIRCVDLGHKHNGIIPHVHLNLSHGKNGEIDILNDKEIKIIEMLRKKGIKIEW